jgi:outer membrane protein TolC
MPRTIWLVCLFGCVGCVGTGKTGLRPDQSQPQHDRQAALDVQDAQKPQASQVEVQSVGYWPGDRFELPKGPLELPPLKLPPLKLPLLNPPPEKVLVSQRGTPDTLPPPKSVLAYDPTAKTETSKAVINLNLPTALAAVDGRHPAIGLAQWRVKEAYARLEQAQVLWLPSIRAGVSYHKHDGNYQASDGSIVDVNRNSLLYGLGVGATGAGTMPFPGVVARFHFADAIFQPKIARNTASARGHAAAAAVNQQLMSAAVGYLDLIGAHQDMRIVEATRDRTADLFKLTSDFAATGKGLRADADRMATELALVENRLVSARERIDVSASRLVQTLSLDAGSQIVPMDPTVVPIQLVSPELDRSELIRTGLGNRPELKESQSLVAAACDQHRRQKYAPFVPSVLLGFSKGKFGGGLGSSPDNTDDRYDFDALVSWELRNLGFGERAARHEASSRFEQSKFEKLRMMDAVAREVAESHAGTQHRAQQIVITLRAIKSADDSHRRNLSRIRDGQGLPLEVLQSLRALEDARRAYLTAVVDYNESQFRLQWSLGWPVTAPEPETPTL